MVTAKIAVRFAWWVKATFWLAKRAPYAVAWIGIDRLTRIVMHGTITSVEVIQ